MVTKLVADVESLKKERDSSVKVCEEKIVDLEQKLAMVDQEKEEKILELEQKLAMLEANIHGDKPISEGLQRVFPMIEETWQQMNFSKDQMQKMSALRSCTEYKRQGFTESGLYFIDPDGRNNGLPPLKVQCGFEDGSTTVELKGSSRNRAPRCTSRHCQRIIPLTYNAPVQQIVNIIDKSEHCRQEIQFDCTEAPLFDKGRAIGKWLNRAGQEKTYFMKTCMNVAKNLKDKVVITNKGDLPMTGFRHGKLNFKRQKASVTVSSLMCFGEADVPVDYATSCRDLKGLGEVVSGYYQVNADPASKILKTVYCNFSVSYNDPGMESLIGRTDLRGSVAFEVHYLRFPHYGVNETISPGIVTYPAMTLNLGGGMDNSTGKFTAPRDGNYVFQVTGTAIEADAEITLYYNYLNLQKIPVEIWHSNRPKGHHDAITTIRPFTFFSTRVLKKGEQIWLEIDRDSTFFIWDSPFRFMGYILPEF